MEQKSGVRIEIRDVKKSFRNGEHDLLAVDGVSFDVYDGEFLVLLGPGRCGKSVLIEMICGLMDKDSGSIRLDGEEITGPNPKLGMVFQRLGLLPWLTVMENAELGPKMRKIGKEERRKTAQHYIDMVGLTGFENYYPYQLSGGMKQRVGIARAYTNGAEIMVMDEPFGQLDAQTRYSMQQEIVRISEQEKRTIIFITNNIEEALAIGDRIILFTKSPAQVEQIYDVKIPKPRNEISEEFLALRKEITDRCDLAL